MKSCAAVSAFVFVLSIFSVARSQNNCQPSLCVPIGSCPELASLLTKVLKPKDVKRLTDAKCISQANPRSKSYVCCIATPQPAVTVDTSSNPTQINEPSDGQGNVLPTECGVEPTTIKIFDGQEAELDEYPWMAVLEYERRNGSWTVQCGGFLINKRYVVTAAHCVTGREVRNLGKLINIRIGEYDLTKERDCVMLNRAEDCSTPVQHFGIEELIIHENYVPPEQSFTKRDNDIALIRLSGNARIGRFVGPICLPSNNFRGTQTGRQLVVAGWGQTRDANKSAIKMKAKIFASDFQECQEAYQRKRITLENSQICANHPNSDSCRGDSGGPLMAQQNNFWVAEGIVSFGLGCGQNIPSVYTKVQSFVPWITSNMRP